MLGAVTQPPPPPGIARYGPGLPVPPPKRKGMSAIAIIAIIVGVCCGLGAIGAVINAVTPDPRTAGSQTTANGPAPAVDTTTSASAAPTSAAPPPPPPSPAGPATTFGPGMYEVGVDIKAGTYTCTATGSLGGYWERARNASGEFGAIIANDAFDGKSIVTVKAKEFFKVTAAGCTIR